MSGARRLREGVTATTPSDADVEMLWTIAEAFRAAKQTSDALSVYQSILKSSAEQPARLATIQKAMANLRMGDVEKLLGRMQGRKPTAAVKYQLDERRHRARAHQRLSARRAYRARFPAPQLAAFTGIRARPRATRTSRASSPGTSYKTKAYREALEWFKLALEQGGDAMIAHGLARFVARTRHAPRNGRGRLRLARTADEQSHPVP